MTAPVLSGQTRQVEAIRERHRKRREQELLNGVPPESLLLRDNTTRYERNGSIYATDGKVGVLKRVVVDETNGEVVEIVVQALDRERLSILPFDLVDRSAGSALFLSINHVEFDDRAANGPAFEQSKFTRADIKSMLRRRKSGEIAATRRSIANAGEHFVETPAKPPNDR